MKSNKRKDNKQGCRHASRPIDLLLGKTTRNPELNMVYFFQGYLFLFFLVSPVNNEKISHLVRYFNAGLKY